MQTIMDNIGVIALLLVVFVSVCWADAKLAQARFRRNARRVDLDKLDQRFEAEDYAEQSGMLFMPWDDSREG